MRRDNPAIGMPTHTSDIKTLIPCFLLISVIYVFYGWDRLITSIELLTIKQAFSLSPQNASLLSSIFTLGLAIMAIPASIVVIRLGIKIALIASTLLFSLSTLSTAFCWNFSLLTLSRIGTGLGEAIFSVALFSLIAQTTPKTWRGTVLGGAASIFGLSISVGPSVIAHIDLWSKTWKAPFILIGSLGILSAFALMFYFLWQGEIKKDDPIEKNEITLVQQIRNIKNLLRTDIAISLFVSAINGLGCYAYLSMYHSYAVTTQNMNSAQAALGMDFFGFGTILGGIPIGYCLDRWGRKNGLFVLLLLTGIIGYFLFSLSLTVTSSCLISLIFGMGVSGIYSNSYALIQEQVAPHYVITATGVFLTIYYLAAAYSGPIFLHAMHLSYGSFWLYTLPYTITALLLLISLISGKKHLQKL